MTSFPQLVPRVSSFSTAAASTKIPPNRARRRRDKVFGDGPCIPRDRNAKIRIQTRARALMHRTEPGKHYGDITAKFFAVLKSLLWDFHNANTGRCFPSYATIAEKAHCAESTVGPAIVALEEAGLLTWSNRIKRIHEWVPGLFGEGSARRERVVRTSNAYVLIDPQPSKTEIKGGTINQTFFEDRKSKIAPHRSLIEALDKLKRAMATPSASNFVT